MASHPIRRVAVIGAGVSGVLAAAHLKSEGLDVTVFERAPVSGGVCPAYDSLKNNVPTELMEVSLNSWKPNTESFVGHRVLAEYIQDTALNTGTVLIIGGSASSVDIAKEIAPIAKKVWQSTRGGAFDHPISMLPENATRVAEVSSFSPLLNGHSGDSSAIPGTVTLVDGQVLENIDRVIVATGYQFTLPFLPEHHRDDLKPEDAGDHVLVSDGLQLHNLHKDIFYIPDPTLAFVGVPFYTATFSLFEFQAIAVAAFFSGQAALPSELELRSEYNQRVKAKGYGKKFHSLWGEDVEYAASLMEWVNQGRAPSEKKPDGYSQTWIETKEKMKLVPNPKNSLYQETQKA
ncbi:hypothetical protein G7Z17_g4112 [Cylindrodendrum hubeiense]|uniref:FAD dependent oxidoreductase domain-containing protein n=1 Tax=Cylindrodendrum hubeiense TaxID=595255 RepID=A0A9P5HEJ8_9HYPO|nr:hypothetical protein G7Z17_g4112 [Cylindrodendrum hubeiense]